MSSARFLHLESYDCQLSAIAFSAHDAVPLMDPLNHLISEFDIEFSSQFSKGRHLVTVSKLNKIGASYVELFLAQLKLRAVETYGADQWLKFVSDLRLQAAVKNPLKGTTIFKSDLFKSNARDCLRVVNELLDVRSLAVFQTVAFGAVTQRSNKEEKNGEEKKRDYSKIRSYFSPVWKRRAEEHYPSGPTLKWDFSMLPTQPSNELDYNARYFASALHSQNRLLLHSLITGNQFHLSMVSFQNLSRFAFTRGMYPRDALMTVKQYNHVHLLQTWWEKFIVPFYQLHAPGRVFDFDKRDSSGYRIIDKAISFYQTDTVKFLLEQKANLDGKSLFVAAKSFDTQSIKLCLEKGIDIDSRGNSDNATSLMQACQFGNSELTNYLLESKASPNLFNVHKETPLHFAAWTASTGCVIALLKAKADCKAVNERLETALHWTVENSDWESLEALLNQQAEEKLTDVSNPLLAAATTKKNTPFHLALLQQKEKMANRLLQAAAFDVNVLTKMLLHTNERQQSTLVLAAAFPTSSMLETILRYALRYSIQLPKNEIEKILDKVNNNPDILELLYRAVPDEVFQERIIKLAAVDSGEAHVRYAKESAASESVAESKQDSSGKLALGS